MCDVNIKQYVNSRCATFVMSVIISFVGLGMSIAGISGVFTKGPDPCFWTSLIMLVVGVWCPSPSLHSKKENELHVNV